MILVAVALAATACGGGSGGSALVPSERVAEILLAPNEAPGGTKLNAKLSSPRPLTGTPALLIPSAPVDPDPPGHQSHHMAVFDGETGLRRLETIAIVFKDEDAAAAFLDPRVDVLRQAPEVTEIDASDLGDERYAAVRVRTFDDETIHHVRAVWRLGNVFLLVEAIGDEATNDLALEVAATINDRADGLR